MRGLGTIINLITVAAGGLLGVFAGHRFPEPMRRTIMQGLGLVTLAVAVVGFAPLQDDDQGLTRTIVMICSIVIGAVIGEALRLEQRLESLGERLRQRLETGDEPSSFVEGFVVASTVFCVGPMTILGTLEDGLGLGIRLLAIKSTLDGIAAAAFAAVYGWGVLASLITVLVVQGALTALAVVIDPLVTDEVLAQLAVTGSLLILAIAFRLLDLVRIPVANLLPAVPLAMVAAGVLETL